VKLSVINFWDGAFDGDFFDFFFRRCFTDLNYTNRLNEADLVVTSVFGRRKSDPAKTVCFIGENIRPSYAEYSYSLSFDYDPYGGRNHRLPLWWARLAWDGFEQKPRRARSNNHGFEGLIPIKPLLQKRKLDLTLKKEFCAMIAGKAEGLRLNLFSGVSEHRKVHGFGNMFGKPLRKSKFDVLPEYKFCLCPENSIYSGYTTEKLLDAYAGGTVPIYSGDLGKYHEFNSNAFINYYDTQNAEDMTQSIKKYDEDDSEYTNIYQEPLLLKEPKLDDAIAFVRGLVK
jgi:hypothetical protein